MLPLSAGQRYGALCYSDLFNLHYHSGLLNELDEVHFLFKDLENPI
jgi:hypothetical protein